MLLSPIIAAIRTGLITSVALVVCSANIAHAGLSGPPHSYCQPTSDGKHMLVMLSTCPVWADRGNACTLPDGQKVNLRDEFPKSGLYQVGSTKPVWTADWYGERRHVVLSADGRYAVRINRFGAGTYGFKGGALSWGIKFYDRGVEIKSHDVADLIDYPCLMPHTDEGKNLLCFYDIPEVLDGRYFDLRTSTRATYRFDVTTGEIVKEKRFWRYAARASIVTVAIMAILGGAWLVVRIRKPRVTPTAGLPADSLRGPTNHAKKRTFDLRFLFVVMTSVAIFCWLPHVATFALSGVLAVLATRWSRRRMRTMTGSRWQKCAARMLLSIPCIGWFLCYTLSLGPTLFLVDYFQLPYDLRQVLLQVPYAPLVWLSRTFPVYSIPPLNWYLEAWS